MASKKLPEPYADIKDKPIHVKIVERPRSLLERICGFPKYWIYVSQGYRSYREPGTAVTLKGAYREAERLVAKWIPEPDVIVCEKDIDLKELLKRADGDQ